MSNPEDYIGFLISDVARLMRTAFDRRVRELGLTRAQWMVLTRLHRRAGASQSELADMMEVERASAGRLIDRLEAKGWVERRVPASDRRVNRIYLTPEAERIHKRIWKIAEATVADAMAGLSDRETAQLVRLLKRVKVTLIEDVALQVPLAPTVRRQRRAKPGVQTGSRPPRNRQVSVPAPVEDEEVVA